MAHTQIGTPYYMAPEIFNGNERLYLAGWDRDITKDDCLDMQGRITAGHATFGASAAFYTSF